MPPAGYNEDAIFSSVFIVLLICLIQNEMSLLQTAGLQEERSCRILKECKPMKRSSVAIWQF
jgi:hypothetical protein